MANCVSYTLKVVGDMAKLREALEMLLNVVRDWDDHLPPVIREGELQEAYRKADAALSAPPRNCDVGTADEQAERYRRYCDTFTNDGMHCETCPCCGQIPFGKCEFAWAQMPYEEEGEL